VKAIRSTTNRANSALRRLEKLINRASSNRLTKALKYIKAEFPNIDYIT
jgi:ribosomal protein L17